MNLKQYLIIAGGCCLMFLGSVQAFGQTTAEKYFTKEGHIKFHSETAVETIEADNYKSTSVLDLESGAMEFAVLIKAFEFEKALMQEHFNENYMESDEFPKSKFKGTITNLGDVNFAEAGTYTVKVAGDLTIHGETNPVETEGTLEVGKDGSIKALSSFIVKPADYGIKIPAVVVENIAEELTVSVDLDYQPFTR